MSSAPIAPNVVYVLPNTMGGMLNIVAALIEHRPSGALPAHVVFTDNANVPDTRFVGTIAGAVSQQVVHHRLPEENLHTVLRRLRRAIPAGPGVLVCNDLLDLALPHVWDSGRMVVQMLHADHDYYYDLAERHQGVVAAFVTYSRAMHERLRRRLPHRAADVHHLPYGVTLPTRRRTGVGGKLRAVFAGRLEHGQKGVLDLPLIDAAMRRRGVNVDWSIIGAGPDERALREAWPSGHVRWLGALSRAVLLDALPEFDVFVLPSRAEGLPVGLVEAMGAGLVPIVSDLTSGIPELIDDGVDGFRRSIGDIDGFADAIARVSGDRARLEQMSQAAARRVRDFDPIVRAANYQALFATWAVRPRSRVRPPLPYGSRLDQPWIPNFVVRTVRAHAVARKRP
jgi:glycosyltransferase involved in cell wall biosynthesis